MGLLAGAWSRPSRFIDRFSLIDDAAYHDIRTMLATIETTGWTSLTQTAIER